ncbi:MAG: 50S ribosomal protein L18 [Treponema sp.]|jgi:large subunit ribosomal protein L18|nr:50S ribosomal protein L18 [Treponema sp.]
MLRKMPEKDRKRLKRKVHIRKRIVGTAERPRLSVFRSNKRLSIQAIDDQKGQTIASISTLEKELRDVKPNVEGGSKVGELIGKRLAEKNITSVVFDRNGYLYHGVVKAMAEGARKAGLAF